MTVTLVAAVGQNRVIGRDGDLPWHLPGDLQRFKALTWSHVLVMGRRTYDAIGRPLPGRATVVVTRQADWCPPGGPYSQVVCCGSVEEALELAATLDDQVFVVGGGQIYRETLPRADRLVITWVDRAPAGDTYFPRIPEGQWDEVARDDHDGCSVVDYRRISTRAKEI